jgi:hypothetical protein
MERITCGRVSSQCRAGVEIERARDRSRKRELTFDQRASLRYGLLPARFRQTPSPAANEHLVLTDSQPLRTAIERT